MMRTSTWSWWAGDNGYWRTMGCNYQKTVEVDEER